LVVTAIVTTKPVTNDSLLAMISLHNSAMTGRRLLKQSQSKAPASTFFVPAWY